MCRHAHSRRRFALRDIHGRGGPACVSLDIRCRIPVLILRLSGEFLFEKNNKSDGILQLFIDQSCHLNTDAAR